MRFEELHLERYGHFDGLRLNLSGDGVLLHIVYGPNEAGKSTALAAVCDLLFGIHERTPFNFVHEYGRLRIGATITNAAGATLSFKRRKARVNSLLKPDESGELPDGCLAPFLGTTTRTDYERMFGLTHERLRAAGRSMLEAGGDLARSLFEAGSGTAGLAAVARSLADEADGLGSPGRKSATRPYWRAYERYDRANERIRQDALKADAWIAAERAVVDAEARRLAIEGKLDEHRRQRTALERVRRVAPLLRRLDELAGELQSLSDAPVLPEDFEDSWLEAVQLEQTARESARSSKEALARIEAELSRLGDPGPWPNVAEAVQQLNTGLGDYQSKCSDLPNRVRDLEHGSKQMAGLVRQLGTGIDPARAAEAIPSDLAVARVRGLVAEWNRLDAAREAATQEVEQAELALRKIEEETSELGSPRDPAAAYAALDLATSLGDPAGRQAKAALELRDAEDELARSLAALGHSTLGADELARIPFPSTDVVIRHEQTFDRIASDRRSAERGLAEARNSLAKIEAELEGVRASGPVPTEEAVRSAREHRDSGWRGIRRRFIDGTLDADGQIAAFAPDGDIAGAFEVAIRTADQLVDGREREAQRIGQFAALIGRRAEALASITGAEDSIRNLNNQQKQADQAWAALWASTGVAPDTPAEMRSWLARKDDVLAALRAARKAALTVRTAEEEGAEVRSHLLRAAAELGLGEFDGLSLATLRDRVKVAYDCAQSLWAKAAELRKALADRQSTLSERARNREKVGLLLDAWRERWGAEMPGIGLNGSASPAEAEAALGVWEKISAIAAEMEQTSVRRRRMEDSIRSYEEAVAKVLRDLGPVVEALGQGTGPLDAVPALQERVSAATKLAVRLEEVRFAAARAAETYDLAEQTAMNRAADLARLRTTHGLNEDADVLRLARLSVRRRAVEAELLTQRRALAAQGDGRIEATLREEVATVEPDAAAADIERLEGDIARLQVELQDAAQAVAMAERHRRDLSERDGVGNAAQEANGAAAEMVALAERWLRLKAASMILNRAVERYRSANQHPLVRRASEIFATVAIGADNPIVRLSVDYTDEDRPALVGFRRDGSMCPVSGMSDGTVDQLYLALRIAAIERSLENAEPLPFVADDLFITSDEERTIPGIKALAELGKRTQVLLFTHHRYVVDAASEALDPGEFKVHSLRTAPVVQALEVIA